MREYLKELAAIMKSYLESNNYVYDFNEKEGTFKFELKFKFELNVERKIKEPTCWVCKI